MRTIILLSCLVIVPHVSQLPQTDLAPTKASEQSDSGSPRCVSLEMFTALQARSMNSGHPSWMMGERYANLQETLEGYRRTGVPLVAYDGVHFTAAAPTDDAGLYYLVPKLARSLNLDLVASLKLFFLLLFVGASAAALGAAFLMFKDWLSRVVALLGLVPLVLISYWAKDLYAVQSAIVVGVVPWFLYLMQRARSQFRFACFLFFTGVVCGISDLVRVGSGMGVIIFVLCVVSFWSAWRRNKKLLLVSALLVGALIPRVYFRSLLHSRDAYLARQQPQSLPSSGAHPFWHSAYIGFGFLSNPYVPAYRDEVAVRTVCSIAPQAGYVSAEYESVLKGEVWRLVKEHPEFALQTLAAKLGVIAMFLLLFAHLGLPAAFFYPKSWPVELGFWCAMGFNALLGLLIVPHYAYLLGFAAFASIYGIVSICHAIGLRNFPKSSRSVGLGHTGLVIPARMDPEREHETQFGR
jgi:hypothetical protein